MSTWVQGGPDTSTNKVPNASPTTASASSDLYGHAVLNACEQIKSRMKPVAKKGMLSTFAKLASACYFQRIDMSAHGFYATHVIGFDWSIGKGTPFNWFTWNLVVTNNRIDVERGSIIFVFTNAGNWW